MVRDPQHWIEWERQVVVGARLQRPPSSSIPPGESISIPPLQSFTPVPTSSTPGPALQIGCVGFRCDKTTSKKAETVAQSRNVKQRRCHAFVAHQLSDPRSFQDSMFC
eukprot:TRINITY_DN44893_c0_g1_i1.p2 TRINITY_DN44893_c0_g1~~TRINITY_DN44893_c0_g1_i1.p2  ORF type:complete len:108 (+),score=0.93 TRINITY_DN44893_c0_g1_i1:76-399(+)